MIQESFLPDCRVETPDFPDGMYLLPRGFVAVVTTPVDGTVERVTVDPKARCAWTGFWARSCACWHCQNRVSFYAGKGKP